MLYASDCLVTQRWEEANHDALYDFQTESPSDPYGVRYVGSDVTDDAAWIPAGSDATEGWLEMRFLRKACDCDLELEDSLSNCGSYRRGRRRRRRRGRDEARRALWW